VKADFFMVLMEFSMRRRVVITGLGTYNPLGNDTSTTWENIVEGRSGIANISRFDTSGLKTKFGGEVKDFDPVSLFGSKKARRMDRVSQLAMAAADQAIADAGLTISSNEQENTGVVLGCGLGNIGSTVDGVETFNERGARRVSPFFIPMMLADSPASSISIAHGFRGPNMAIATACAAGNNAIGEAAHMIRRGSADIMIAGGAEAPIIPVVIAGFNAAGAMSTHNDEPGGASRPFDAYRDGFVVSEGAAILILEELNHARNRDAEIYAEFLGYGTSADAYHITAPAKNGAGAVRSMSTALDDAAMEPKMIDYINAHGTATKLNDKIETLAIKSVFGERAYDVPVSSTKSMHGHLLGAAGALEAVVSIKALKSGILPATINYNNQDPQCDLDYVPNLARKATIDTFLSNGFGLGGHNASIIIGRYNGAG
jgi:3-oxoacyl-[acyl-carrier-protein] synthase II